MPAGSRNLATLAIAAAVLWHALSVLTPAWVLSRDHQQGRDFASYFYAVQVAANGGDPYDKRALGEAARDDGHRRGVHPFLYAPPFLLWMSWAVAYDLPDAYHLWFWLDELCALGAALVLWLWWRPRSPHVGWVLAIVVAAMTAIPNNHQMGQANFIGLLLALAGLWQTDRGRPWRGGALMGAACMLKMSPALFVVWWLVRREWTAVGGSVAAAVVLSLLSLPLAGPAVQLEFYTRILPSFGSGWYNGLAVSIGLFGNHSLANLIHQILPPADATARMLSPAANAVSVAASISALGAMAFAFRAPDPNWDERAAQASCVSVLLLLLPVYTYEHHLVFAIPAMVLGLLAVGQGRLAGPWTVVVGLCVAMVLFDLATLKRLAEGLPDGMGALAWVLKEAKFFALVGLVVVTGWLGMGRGLDGGADGQ